MMIGICMLFCLTLLNGISGIDGVGEEATNGNGKNDLLFGEMWRKAFASNWHNGKKTEEKETAKKKVKKEEQTEEIREEQKEEGENKLWKTVKKESIDELREEEKKEEGRDGKKWQKAIKKEPKNEQQNEWEDLIGKSGREERDQQQEEDGTASDQNDSDQSADYSRITRKKIAKEMGEKIEEMYRKKETRTRNERSIINDETKLEIIKEFDKMRKEYKMIKEYKSKDRANIEEKIAKELGTGRDKIYKWRKELLNRGKKPVESEEKWEIIKKFDKLRKEHKNKKKMREKIERKIARELGTHRNKIYEWKKEINQKKKLGREERKEIVEKFDKMRKECKNRKEYKANDRIKIEREIAKELGTHRDKIFRWKREFAKSKPPEKRTNEQKCQIIELFDKLCEEFANKFNRKAGEQIKDKIARKFGVSRTTIGRWKKKKHRK